MSIVYTETEKCKGCYACIRACPAKAIKVEEGRAQVIKERCIVCGTCLKVCATGAKRVESDVGLVWQLLSEPAPVIAIPSSSWPAAFPGISAGQLVGALQKLGFAEVLEDAFGAELIALAYSRLLKEGKTRPILSSHCPAVTSYVEKYHPELVHNLAPIVSPTIAMGRLIKQSYNPEARVVFIGPCVGKKAVERQEKFAGVIDGALTFAELKEMFSAKGVDLAAPGEAQFTGPKPNLGRLFSVAGGLLKVLEVSDDILQSDVISAHGREYVMKILRELSRGDIKPRFVNMYFCHGCIDGPVIDNDLSGFRRKELVASYTRQNADPEQTARDVHKFSNIDLTRDFSAQSVGLAVPRDEEVQTVLASMGHITPEEQYNCGACGYITCRELAIAVCQGLAETKMCWPYVLRTLHDAQEGMIQAEKLTSLGQLAASIAHEVNNPLAGVLIYTQLLAKRINADKYSKETSLEYLAKMETELIRSTKLIRGLLDFARQSPPALREIDINEVVIRSFELASHSAKLQHVEAAKELDPALPMLKADFDQLQQVCTNLIINAIQAMPDGGKLTLRTVSSDGQVGIVVGDTGYGISPENMRKLFTPFFTTKGKGGVGLGLAVAYGIVERHHGKIEVQSKVGEGTTFTIKLPTVPGKIEVN